MKTVMRIKWGRLIGSALITAAMVLFLGWVLFHAVLQESFKITPPTDAELQEDPSLVRYLPEDDPRIEVYGHAD